MDLSTVTGRFVSYAPICFLRNTHKIGFPLAITPVVPFPGSEVHSAAGTVGFTEV